MSLPFDGRWLFLLFLPPSLGLVMCGSGDPGKTFKTDRPILRLTLSEYRISPQNIEAKASRIKIEVHNIGSLPHNLVIEKPPDDPEDEPVEVPGTPVPTMFPGQAAKPTKVTLSPGTYRLRCTIGNHDILGEYGELRVDR